MAEIEDKKEILKKIPSVDNLLNSPDIKSFAREIRPGYLTTIIRYKLDEYRNRLLAGEELDIEFLKKGVIEELEEITQPYFSYAVNGLGIILHTGLGRAPFSFGVLDALNSVGRAYSRLQIDEEGKRADRYRKISKLLKIITGAESGMIVNNNAGASLLILNTIAPNREVIISRGQLVEIGGSFRIPEVMAQSGAILREVGTTNRTHLRDYESAISEKTAAIMRVHQSNYRIFGFTKDVPLEELVSLGRKYNLPVIEDLGSGALIDFSKYGLPKEPLVQDSIKAGADIVCFSGDKLIGGPQCGIILGKDEYIQRLKKNPLTRALRCDKLTNAALEATLRLFLKEEEIILKEHNVISLLLKPLKEIKNQAKRCARLLNSAQGITYEIKESVSEIGGGSLSTEQLPTYVLSIKTKELAIVELARRLRKHSPPVFGRIEEDALLIDFRTVFWGEEKIVGQAIIDCLKSVS